MGKQWEQFFQTDYFWGFKISEVVYCSHEIKRYLLLGRKAMTNLDSLIKSRDITLSAKVHLVKAMVYPLVTYGCESWHKNHKESWGLKNWCFCTVVLEKTLHSPLNAFALWCWRRFLTVPWTARRSNQSILKEISPGCWSWNSNTLATWCEELTHWKIPWCWERLKAKGEKGSRGWDG